MKTKTSLVIPSPILIAVGLICAVIFSGAFQEPTPTPEIKNAEIKNDEVNNTDRIGQLEKRVAILERILFSSAKLDTQRAERLLADRRARLKNSRELFAKGLITEFEIQLDRQQVDEAERELELATTGSRHHQLVSELEILQAERQFRFATDQLEYRRRMSIRGFATVEEVNQLEKMVDIADRNLKHAKTKLEAAKELEGLKK